MYAAVVATLADHLRQVMLTDVSGIAGVGSEQDIRGGVVSTTVILSRSPVPKSRRSVTSLLFETSSDHAR